MVVDAINFDPTQRGAGIAKGGIVTRMLYTIIIIVIVVIVVLWVLPRL